MQPLQSPSLYLQRLPCINCYHFRNHKVLSSDLSAPTLPGVCMRADSCLFYATLLELSRTPCYAERMTCLMNSYISVGVDQSYQCEAGAHLWLPLNASSA
jgi:hypothetical protein